MEQHTAQVDGYTLFGYLSSAWFILCVGILLLWLSDNITTVNNELDNIYKAREMKLMTKHNEVQDAKTNVIDLVQTTRDKHECVHLRWEPQVAICIHGASEDIHVSKSIKELGVYQAHVMTIFKFLLVEDPYLGFIDIGANIGQFSLVASAMGRPLEPRLMHVEMIHHSILINNMHRSNFVLLHNTISNDYGKTFKPFPVISVACTLIKIYQPKCCLPNWRFRTLLTN